MAKSIRSKMKKRFRATKRATVGEAQTQKTLRKTLRRLETSLNEGPTHVVDEATGKIVTTGRPGLDMLKAALSGPTAAARELLAAGAVGREPIRVRGAEPVTKRKQLRYTFNTKLRQERLAAQLEDETDDEDDVRLGRVRKPVEDEDMAGSEEDAAAAADGVEESGVHKPADKPVRKRDNGPKFKDNLRDGCGGLFDSDPALVNPKRSESHRKTRRRGMDSETLGAIGEPDAEPDTDDIIKKMLNSGKGHGAKASYKFWAK